LLRSCQRVYPSSSPADVRAGRLATEEYAQRFADGNLRGSAQTILDSNALGGMRARVCPTENLCEAVCVRNTQEDRPVGVGRLQRHAVDALLGSDKPQVFMRAPATGKKVAVVGAGPADLSGLVIGEEVRAQDLNSLSSGDNLAMMGSEA
jgi:glutamate synthase (NADPH/NADH) small chain